MPELPSNFSGRLSLLIKEEGFSQRELARLIGVAHGTVAGWLRGSVPQRRVLELLSQKLNVTVQWLEHGHGNRIPISTTKPDKGLSFSKALKNVVSLRKEFVPSIQAYKSMAADLRQLADRYDQKATQLNREMVSAEEKIGRNHVAKTIDRINKEATS